jgi:signal transduction histidine kinase
LSAHSDVIETAEALNREITRVEGLIRRLVDFSKPLAPRVEVTTVEALLEAATDAAQPALVRHAVTVDRSQDADLQPVEVDPLLFTQVLVNLLVNACEGNGSRRARNVLVRLLPEQSARSHVRFELVDDGPGFHPELLQASLGGGLTTKPAGTGLGLSLIAHVVEASGGAIELRNLPEGGACVSMSLRLAQN